MSRRCQNTPYRLGELLYSKTINPRLYETKPACAGYTELFRAYPNNAAARTAIKPQTKRHTGYSDRLQ